MSEENEQAPDTTEQEPTPLRGHEELYKEFLTGLDEESAERKKAAHDESENNPLKDIESPEALYKIAMDNWDTREAPAEDEYFDATADSTAFSDYVEEHISEINRMTFRGVPALTHEESGDFATFLESFRALDITTAAERSRNLILMQRRGEDVSGALIQAGLNQIDHRKGVRDAPAPAAEE